MNVYSTPGLMTADRTSTEGGNNVAYDLLGTNQQFQKTYKLDLYVGQDNDQVVALPFPAFAHVPKYGGADTETSDIIVKLVSITKAGVTEDHYLTYRPDVSDFDAADEGWVIEEVDQNAMGKAHYLWNRPQGDFDFNGTIVGKIRVKDKAVSAENKLTLEITYQAFYTDVEDTDAFRSETGPEYSKELGQNILDRLAALELRTDVALENMFGNTAATQDILDEDLTGVAPDNKVVNELHTADTTTGKSLLAPAKGSFYPGKDVDGTKFRMFMYEIEQGTVTESLIASEEKLGWLFIYTLNNLTSYEIPVEPTFLSHAKYFTADVHGIYHQLKSGVDYHDGDNIEAYKTAHGSREVFILKRIPFDPKKQLDGLINDTSAVITTQQSVVLTDANIRDYMNYSGTFVNITDEATELTLGVDYEFANVNLAKTEKTYARQPVYDHIRLLGNITTDAAHRIGITYQAFGGQVQPSDVRNIRQDLTNLLNILAKGQLLTYSGLKHHPAIQELVYRVARMEDYHHHFNQVNHIIPLRMVNVVTVPGGTSHEIADESDLQWFNIARLSGSKWMEGPTAYRDIGHFRISSRVQGWTYEFFVTVDLSEEGDNRMTIKVVGGTGQQYADVDDFVALTTKELVGARLVWNGNNKNAGAMLQIGIDYSRYHYDPATDTRDTDTITVTNKSGDTSSWELFYNPLATTYTAGTYIGVYGRSRYQQIAGENAKSGVSYYKLVDDYTYFVTNDDLVRDGELYFRYNEIQKTYENVAVISGSRTDSYEFTLYQRKLYRSRWERVSLQDEQPIHLADKVYVVKDIDSCDTYSCTLPDGQTKWGTSDPDSLCIARILERDDGGTVVWVGSTPLAYFSLGPDDAVKTLQLHLSLSNVFQKYLDIESIKSLDFTFYDRKLNQYITKKINTYIDDLDPSVHVKGEGIFFMEDFCGLEVKVGRLVTDVGPDSYFQPGVMYFTGKPGGTDLAEYDAEGLGKIGTEVLFDTTSDTVFSANRVYWKYVDDVGYLKMKPGLDYNIGSPVSGVGFEVYTSEQNFFMGIDLISADLNVALGTSSYINQRFDLRQVRMHM